MKKYIAFFSFSLLTFPLLSQNTDIRILYSLNSGNSRTWDNTNKIFSKSATPVSLAAPAGLFLYGVFSRDSSAKRNAIVMAAGLSLSGILSTGMKHAFNRTRPFLTYSFIVKKSNAGSPSFPSGHTSSAFETATSLSLCYPKWYIIVPSFLWASAVGYSRMELGVHYPSDVFAGAFIGAGASWLAWKLNKHFAKRK